MKKSLFLSMALLAAFPAAQAYEVTPLRPVAHQTTLKPGVTPKFKTVKNLNPMLETQSNQNRLDESFENPDKIWPVGWSTDLTNPNDWMIYTPGMSGISTTDGYYAAMGTCLELHDASWLISPKLTVVENDELMFDLYFDVRALYVWKTEGEDKTVDEEDGLILKRENAENMKVCIREVGGQWVELLNLWDQYGNLGYWTILDEYPNAEFRPFRINLADYVGKEVEIGFCHSYTNEGGGHGMFLDAVKVGLPPISVSYVNPMNLLFFGLSNSWDGLYDAAIAPPYVDRTWTPEIDEEVTKTEWTYTSLAEDKPFTSSESELTTNYTPFYGENPEAALTPYSFPTLSVSNSANSNGTFTYANGDGAIYVGAAPELPHKDGGMISFGYATFNLADDLNLYNCDFSTPGYGYIPDATKDWWTNHFFHGDQGIGDEAEIISNINFFYAQGLPMVVNGVRVACSVECQDDAEFKMEIIEMNEDFTMGQVLATATVKGSDRIKIDTSIAPYPNTAILPFEFEEPLIIDGKNFVTRLTGFNSDNVSYYAPIQSYESSTYNFAFADLLITAPSMGQETPRSTLIPAIAHDTDAYCSFAIYLDGCTPWLRGQDDTFSATLEVNTHAFALDSSYPASELTFSGENGAELPAWLKVEGAGQYGAAKVNVTVLQGGKEAEAFTLVASAPGVSKKFTINRGVWTGGISAVTTDSPVVSRTWFDLSGRQLSSEPATGIYLLRTTHADGTVTTTKSVK